MNNWRSSKIFLGSIISLLLFFLSINPAQADPGDTSRVSIGYDGWQGNLESSYPSISADGRFVAFESLADNLVRFDTNGESDIFVHDRLTGEITCVSEAYIGPSALGNGNSYSPSISADGRYVAFESYSTNLVSTETSGYINIFLHDRQVGVTTLVSIASDGTESTGFSHNPSISADGRYVAFESRAANLVDGDTNGYQDIFVRDWQLGQTTRISVSSSGTQANNVSSVPSISADGRFVAFQSSANNLIDNDTNGTSDIFIHDRQTGQTALVSLGAGDTQANSASYYASISADGRYVAFGSSATNLVSGDVNQSFDIFVRDRQTGQTTLVSVASNGAHANSGSSAPSISMDGRYVTFSSYASNLVAADTNGTGDIFLHDRDTRETALVSITSDDAQANNASYDPVISADGSYIVFWTEASNLVANDINGYSDIFISDRQLGQTTRASERPEDPQVNNYTNAPSISADGRFVAFSSMASNLVIGDTNIKFDVFVHDRQTGETTRVSVASDGTQGNADSSAYATASLSADGRYVAFRSEASNLVSGDTNNSADVFVHDRQTGQTSLVSTNSSGLQGNDDSSSPSITADGRYVAFSSQANNLVDGDTNNSGDVFVHNRQTGQTTRISLSSAGAQGNLGSGSPAISADGRYVAFTSYASNLVAGDTNDAIDVFVHDRQTGQTTRASVASDGTQGDGDCYSPAISVDGRYVAFHSWANNLDGWHPNGSSEVFVHDNVSGVTKIASVSSDGKRGLESDGASISADGRYIAFSSYAGLVSGDAHWADVFIHDQQTGQTTRASIASDGTPGNGNSGAASISADGRYVAFQSFASNLVSGDTNGLMDIFVHENDFTGLPSTFTMSGKVVDEGSLPVSGVKLTFGTSDDVMSDSNGEYSFNIPRNWSGTVIPAKEGYTFSPPARTYTNVQVDHVDQNFTAVQLPSPMIELMGLEVTQAIQNLRNDVVLIKDKRTFVRAHVRSTLGTVNNVTAILTARRTDGSFVFRLQPSNIGGQIHVKEDPNRLHPNDSFYFELPQYARNGRIELEFQVIDQNFQCREPDNDGDASNDDDCKVRVTFLETPPLDVKFIDFAWVGDDLSIHRPTQDDHDMVEYEIETVFPIPDLEPKIGIVPVLAPLSGPPTTADDFTRLNRILKAIRSFDGCNNDALLNCQRFYIGILVDPPKRVGDALGGATRSIPPKFNYLAAAYYDPGRSFLGPSHELGHALGRCHTFFAGYSDGVDERCYHDPADGTISEEKAETSPDSYFGLDTNALDFFDWPFVDRPYKVNPIYKPNTPDLMSYGPYHWPSAYTYREFNRFIGNHLFSSTRIPFSSLNLLSGEPIMLISGIVNSSEGTGSLESVYSFESSNSIAPPGSGSYAIRLEDSSGQELLSYNFEPDYISALYVGNSENHQGDLGFFVLTVPQDTNTSRIVLLHNSQELDSYTASSNAPTVHVDYPNGGEFLGGSTATLRWSASDQDGDTLEYVVQYSVDGGISWETLLTDWTSTTYELNLELISGTNAGLLRVLASDGFHTAEDQSDTTFSIAKHLPRVRIDAPDRNRLFVSDQTIIFEGSAFDNEDGQLEDAALSWTSSIDGALGIGHSLATLASTLTEGIHTITLTAQDSDGQTGSTQIVINVYRDRPTLPPSLSSAPSTLDFLAFEGGEQAASQILSVRNDGDGEMSWSASADQGWIVLSSLGGIAPTNFNVSADPTGLPVGEHTGNITITANGANNSPQTIPVTFRVIEAPLTSVLFMSENQGTLRRVNQSTAATTIVGNLGNNSINGLSNRPGDATNIYGVYVETLGPSGLARIDTLTGQATLLPLFDESTLGITNPFANAIAISPAAPDVAVVTGTDVDAGVHPFLWTVDVATGEALGPAIPTTAWVREMAYNLDGSVLYGIDSDGHLVTIDIDTGNVTLVGDPGLGPSVEGLAFRPGDGQLFAIDGGDPDRLLRLDPVDGSLLEVVGNLDVAGPNGLAFVPGYQLSISKSGNGTVTSNPAGINCGLTCSESFTYGSSVSLTATPASGHIFAGWSGACSGTGTCTVSMTDAESVSATFTPGGNVDVSIGGQLRGSYAIASGEERREYYDVSGGPVIVESKNGKDIVSAIRLQSFASNTLYSFVETMGVPSGLLSHKYYFPTYNNTWGPLNSQLRFGNLSTETTRIRVTIGGEIVWEQDVLGLEERREYFAVSGGPVIIESLDPTKKIVAAIRLQSYASGVLYSFAETMGIPDEYVSDTYYFPTYNNTWGPLNSQLRFGNLGMGKTEVRVTIGDSLTETYIVDPQQEMRLYYDVSDGPVIVESLADDPVKGTTKQNIVAAIRLQSYASGVLYSFVETMGVPAGLLSHKYYFPTYNNTWAPLNSQVRFGNLSEETTRIRVTIGGENVWEQDVPGLEERRLYFEVSGGPVIVESLDPTKKIVAAIRLQSYAGNTLYSFSETMGIPDEQMSDAYYFPTYNNTWPPLNSQVRFGIP